MTTLYKLTTPDFTTYNGTLWGPSVEHTAPGGDLCSSDVLHAYASPGEAVFYDPIHGNFGSNAVLWEAEGEICVDDGTKIGCTRLKTIKRIPLPEISTDKRVEIAIRCALLVYSDPSFIAWANKWLSGEDRSEKAAASAAAAVEAAAKVSAWAAEVAAAVAAGAAEIHLHVRDAAGSESLAPAAVDATLAAVRAAEAAAWAAEAAEAAEAAAAAAAADKNQIRNVIQKVCRDETL